MTEPTIAVCFVKAFVDFAVAKGADRQLLLQRSQIRPEDLENEDGRLPLVSYIELIEAGIELCHEPALALHFGEEVPLRDISIVGFVGRGGTAEDSRCRTNRYLRLVIDEGVEQSEPLEFVREGALIWLKFTSRVYVEYPVLTESAFARGISARKSRADAPQSCSLWPLPKAFSFTHKEPSYRAEYDRVFGVPLIFGGHMNAILFGEELLSVRLPPMNRHVSRLITQEADMLLKQLDDSKSTRGRVENLLIPLLHTGDARIETIAAKLGLSRQTLFRQLRTEGVTFEKVLDNLRHKRALYYLKIKKLPVTETAYLLGFSDAASFSRAFKRWTGESPGSVAASIRKEDLPANNTTVKWT
jgi:AraC-like DNA-binding protein